MPIPHLSKKTKSGQSWRNNKRTYYLSRAKAGGGLKRPIKKYKPSRRSGLLDIFKISKWKLFKYGFYAFLVSVVFVFILFAWLSRGLPAPGKLLEREIPQSTKIYDRTGENVLYEIHGEEKRTLVALSEIPDDLKWATITIEDKDFYKHKGFSLWAIFRTVVTNVLFGRKGGGSTLTQQLVKNSILTSEKTYTRKIKELIMAYRMEKKYSKDEILQMYFNEIPYGSTAYGAQAASQKYFGKNVKDVNIAEAAILAALPQAPSRYSPYGSNKDLLIGRQHYILDQMVKDGYIEKEKAEAAKGVELKFKEPAENITAPHFVMYIKEQLSEKYGEKMIEQGGLKIYTTLDLYKQKIAEEVIAEYAVKNKEKYDAGNAALVSIDPKTGQVFAMVGSKDYFDDEIDGQVNIATSLRQPGSSMKPIVYAAAFIKGYGPDTILYDVVTNFSTVPGKTYEPRNYDNQERGPVTIRKALAGSLNVPAVKAIYLADINNVLDLAGDLGYTSFSDRDRFGLSLVLGGGEVKLLEHVNAYSAFAREGKIHPITTILKIEDAQGKVLEEYKSEEKKVMDSNIARMINDVLSDDDARSYVFGAGSWLTLPSRPVAAKTGTTNDYHDAWTIGYTPSIVTGVWVGNSDNAAMKRGADGSVVAAPIWHDFMKKVLGDTPVEQFKKPEIEKTGKPVLDGNFEGTAKVKIDRASGLLATEFTPESFIEEKSFNEAHSILYYINKDDPRGEAPEDPSQDPQFKLWEDRVVAWGEKQGFASSTPPKEYDNLHKPENRPVFSVENFQKNQIVMEEILKADIKATAPRGIDKAEYYIDDNLVFINRAYPFNLVKNIIFLNNGYHKLKVRVCDNIENCSEESFEFNLLLSENQTTGSIALEWASPAGDLSPSAKDFPLSLKVKPTNHTQIAKINFYYANSDGSDKKLIKSHAPIDTDLIEVFWSAPPAPGQYKLFAEAQGWNTQLEKTKEIIITIPEEEKKE